jgi:hypothetical protein
MTKGIEYASVLFGYPLGAFFGLKFLAWIFGFTPSASMYLIVILVAHVFSLIYIVKGLNKTP